MNELGNLIKNARISKGLKAFELAKLIDTTTAKISRIETGITKKPSLNTLLQLSLVLELNFEDVLGLAGYTQEAINLIIKDSYNKVSKYNNYSYLLFLLNCMSNEDFKILLESIAKILNFSKNDIELILLMLNSISELSQKEKDIIKIILS